MFHLATNSVVQVCSTFVKRTQVFLGNFVGSVSRSGKYIPRTCTLERGKRRLGWGGRQWAGFLA